MIQPYGRHNPQALYNGWISDKPAEQPSADHARSNSRGSMFRRAKDPVGWPLQETVRDYASCGTDQASKLCGDGTAGMAIGSI